eukprot:3640786-Pleurochrysis_carterae.AAC.2
MHASKRSVVPSQLKLTSLALPRLRSNNSRRKRRKCDHTADAEEPVRERSRSGLSHACADFMQTASSQTSVALCVLLTTTARTARIGSCSLGYAWCQRSGCFLSSKVSQPKQAMCTSSHVDAPSTGTISFTLYYSISFTLYYLMPLTVQHQSPCFRAS